MVFGLKRLTAKTSNLKRVQPVSRTREKYSSRTKAAQVEDSAEPQNQNNIDIFNLSDDCKLFSNRQLVDDSLSRRALMYQQKEGEDDCALSQNLQLFNTNSLGLIDQRQSSLSQR